MKKIVLLIIIVIFAWLSYSLWYAYALTAADSGSIARINIVIPSGSSSKQIAATLAEKDLIRSQFAFLTYAKKSDKAASLQAGTFVLQPSMTVAEIVEALTNGATQEQSVTIPEGYTVKDIDALLTEKGLIASGQLIDCATQCDFSTFDFIQSVSNQAHRGGKLEGYLYPDTYFVDASDFVVKFFAERMLGTFRTKIVNGLADDIKTSGRSLHDIMIMASLVEEETRNDAERAAVAGILWKRLDEGMGLYVDASNRYILDKPTATITATDLNMDSPYNLRKYLGLTPGPIANPGIKSIQAAMHPESSPYYYYLHGKDGQIRYATTNDEHNLNRAKYLR